MPPSYPTLPGPVLDSTRVLREGTSAVLHAPVYFWEETQNNIKLITAHLSISEVAERFGQTLAYLGKMIVMVLVIISRYG